MKTLLLIFGLLGFIFSGCSSQTDEQSNAALKKTRKDSSKVVLMTEQTELKSAEYLTAEVKVPGMMCKMCEKNISASVKKLDGIIKVNANHKKDIVSVTFDGGKVTQDRIRKSISDAGYDADTVKRDPAAYEALEDCCKIKSTKHS